MNFGPAAEHPKASRTGRAVTLAAILWIVLVNALFFYSRCRDSDLVHALAASAAALWSR